MINNEYFVYTHSVNGKVFYIGQGKIRAAKKGCWSHGVKYERAYTRAGKPAEWFEILGNNKLDVNILLHFNYQADALRFEMSLIKHYSAIQRIANKYVAKTVYQFNFNGNLINSFMSIAEAAKNTGIDQHSILNSINKRAHRNSAGGYLWSFSKTCTPVIRRHILKYDLGGNLIHTYHSLDSAIIDLGKNSTTAIRNCFIGRQKQAYGFKWVDAGYY